MTQKLTMPSGALFAFADEHPTSVCITVEEVSVVVDLDELHDFLEIIRLSEKAITEMDTEKSEMNDPCYNCLFCPNNCSECQFNNKNALKGNRQSCMKKYFNQKKI